MEGARHNREVNEAVFAALDEADRWEWEREEATAVRQESRLANALLRARTADA